MLEHEEMEFANELIMELNKAKGMSQYLIGIDYLYKNLSYDYLSIIDIMQYFSISKENIMDIVNPLMHNDVRLLFMFALLKCKRCHTPIGTLPIQHVSYSYGTVVECPNAYCNTKFVVEDEDFMVCLTHWDKTKHIWDFIIKAFTRDNHDKNGDYEGIIQYS